MESSKILICTFHISATTAFRDFTMFYRRILEESPYFRNQYNKVTNKVRFGDSGPQSTSAILGSQLIYTIISEVSFFRPKDGIEKVDEVLGRFRGRFELKKHFVGGVVCDSSARDEDTSAADHFEESVNPKDLYVSKPSQWEVKPELFAESKGKTFLFYRGDSRIGPRMIEDEDDIIRNNLDRGRIIKVPHTDSTYYQFLQSPVRALRDVAGIGYSGNEKFFEGDLSHLLKCSSLKNYAPELITVDFFDTNDRIFDHVSNMIYRIPKGINLFVSFDIGLQNDICGVSLCYYDGEVMKGNVSLPKFKIPLMFGVSRLKGQSTSIDHLTQFLSDLIKAGYQIFFTADSFASASIFQYCTRFNIPNMSLSVDKTPDPYYFFKNTVTTERIEMPYNNRFLRECSELKITYNGKNNDHMKIDHPLISSCHDFDYKDSNSENPGSKDVVDSVCASLYACQLEYSKRKEDGAGLSKSIEAFKHITADPREEAAKNIQEMIESIY